MAVAVNVAEERPALIVTEFEVRTAALELSRVTLVLRATAVLTCNVQLADALTARLAGVQESDCKVVGGCTVKLVLTLADPAVAEMTTGSGCETFAAVAVKLAVELPAATVTLEGMLSAELLSTRFTIVPPAGALPDNFTEQVVEAGPCIEATPQLTEVSCDCGAAWMVSVVVTLMPAEEAVTMADVFEVTEAAVAENEAVD
jgi:hypothetical protein